jgi:hypothetical protein
MGPLMVCNKLLSAFPGLVFILTPFFFEAFDEVAAHAGVQAVGK